MMKRARFADAVAWWCGIAAACWGLWVSRANDPYDFASPQAQGWLLAVAATITVAALLAVPDRRPVGPLPIALLAGMLTATAVLLHGGAPASLEDQTSEVPACGELFGELCDIEEYYSPLGSGEPIGDLGRWPGGLAAARTA